MLAARPGRGGYESRSGHQGLPRAGLVRNSASASLTSHLAAPPPPFLPSFTHTQSLVRENHRTQSRGLMELWVNQVLDPGSMDLSGRTESLKIDPLSLRGLTQFGLTRVELRGAGLSDASVDRLYRGLYVYTIGFFDMMQVRGREAASQAASRP